MSKGRSGIQMVGRVSSLLQIQLGQQVVLLSTVIPHFVAVYFKKKTEKKIGDTYEYT